MYVEGKFLLNSDLYCKRHRYQGNFLATLGNAANRKKRHKNLAGY